MKKYSVYANGESYDTDSLDEANSVLESMAISFKKAVIIDNEIEKVIKTFEL